MLRYSRQQCNEFISNQNPSAVLLKSQEPALCIGGKLLTWTVHVRLKLYVLVKYVFCSSVAANPLVLAARTSNDGNSEIGITFCSAGALAHERPATSKGLQLLYLRFNGCSD